MSSAPIFILCCSRSGSTLLRYIMDSHPKVYCPQELHLCKLAGKLETIYRSLDPKAGGLTRQQEATMYQNIKKHINQIMTPQAKLEKKEIWCEKSIHTINDVVRVQRVFPNARYISLYRNCLDQVDSMLEELEKYPTGKEYGCDEFLNRAGYDRINGLVDYWLHSMTAIRDFTSLNSKQCFDLRYEDLVETPESTLKDLFRFLQLKWDPQVIARAFKKEHFLETGDHKINSTKKILNTSVDKELSFKPEEISPDRVVRVNKMLNNLGYQPLPGSLAHRAV